MTSERRAEALQRLVYRGLLQAYPPRFRRRYGAQMETDFAELRGRLGPAHAWTVALLDLLRSVPGEWARPMRLRPPRRAPRESMIDLPRDIRHSARSLGRAPGFSALVAATLAVGIGGTVAMFSVVDGVLLSPLPYREPDRLVVLWNRHPALGTDKAQISGPDFLDYREQASTLGELAFLHNATDGALTDGERAEQIDVGYVSWNFFRFLGVDAARGRTFLPEDGLATGSRMGEAGPAVISHALWTRRYGSDPAVLGRIVHVSGRPVQILGVMPPDFRIVLPYAPGGAMSSGANDDADVWRVLPEQAFANMSRSMAVVRVLARLAPGATVEQAQQDLDALAGRLRASHRVHAERGTRIDVVPLQADVVGHVRSILLSLFGAVFVVLLIACGNVANLVSVRANGRYREVAVRLALGAPRGRILRQLFAEYALLAAAGALLGFVLAEALLRAVVGLAPPGVPALDQVAIDLRALGFSVLVASLAALLFGTWPALRATRVSASSELTAGPRGVLGRGNRFRSGLVAVQIALSLVLLVVSGLLVRSFRELQRTSLGFEPRAVLTAKVALGHGAYDDETERRRYWDALLRELDRHPAIASAGLVWPIPFAGQGAEIPYNDTGSDSDDWGRYLAFVTNVSPGYFETMGASLVRGRGFETRDLERAGEIAVVDEQVANRLFPGGDAVGRTLWIQDPRSDSRRGLEILGVVRPIRHSSLTGEERDVVYRLAPEARALAIVVRAAGDVAPVVSELRRVTGALDRDVPLYDERTLASYVGDRVAPTRFTMTLAGGFGVVAFLLAVVGLYGVVSYTVSRRTAELGLRMALGAGERAIVRLILRSGAVLTGTGIAIGIAAALIAANAIRSLLVGVPAGDPLTFGATAGGLAVSALVACYVPARRAARLDPAATLREG